MKTNANSIKIGNIIDFQNQLWKVIKREHVKPGKGGAYIQVEMKNIITGNKTNNRFASSEDVLIAYVEQKNFQFQYFDRDEIVVMDMETFESFNFNKELIGDLAPFLKEEMNLRVEYCNSNPIAIYLPETVEVTILQADSVIKGQTVTSSYKPAIIENGTRVMVPQFIESGEKIIIKTEDLSYVSRAKN